MANRRVRVMWSDLNGLSHGRYVPERRIHDHGHHAVTTLTMGIDREILPVEGYAADVGFPDLSTVPLPSSRRPGWEPDTDVMIADLEFSGGPLALGPRNALKRAVDAWRALGYEPMLGYELEFYVMQPDASAPGGAVPLDLPSHRVYGVGLGGIDRDLTFDLFDTAERCELDIEGIMAEFSPGQMEMNLRYGPALDSSDRAFVAKEMIREVAAEHGHWATFMGRPSGMAVGSGLHINFSLIPTGGGRNVFDDPAGEHGMSPLMRQCIGGMLAHYEALAAMSAPTVNSYKRLIPGIIAGYWANWGLDNRISTLRVPGERGEATRIENRMPCGTANVYLAAAVMLNAALLGVVDGIDCGDPQLGDGDAEPNTDRHTPHTLADALDAFEADAVLCEAMGHDLVRCYTTIRRDEIARWEASGHEWSVEDVTAWELQQYLPFY
jgi:glutamine synthetase